ncbi:MAG: adenylate/guanylate cyclase domain-containing protein [Solirubrobacterales bacterium]
MNRTALVRRKALLLMAAALLAAGVGVAAYATNLLRRSELQSVDARFSIRGRQATPAGVSLVAIDPATLEHVRDANPRLTFPFPRRFDARVIDNLRRAGASAIALDIEFLHETDVRDDNALIEALERAHGKTVLATVQIGRGGTTPVLGGEPHLRELGARPAEARLLTDVDGSVRRFAYAQEGLRSFPVVAVEVATRRPVSPSLFANGAQPIDYAGPPGAVQRLSYWDVLKNRFPAGAVRGKVVLVGATAPILQDLHPTPISGIMSGPEIWANATATLLQGVPLKAAPGWLNVVLIVLLGALTPLSSLRIRPWRALLDALGAAVAFTVAIQLAFNSGLIVSFVYPLLALTIGTLATIAILYMSEAIERARTHDLFARFVPAGVVEEVLASTDENLRLGGVQRDCTVLFSDLRGFTSFAETQTPERVIEVVNHYLNEMTEAIMAAGGTLIAYMGDGIMAVFGAPLAQDDHADRALRAAREMLGQRLASFNDWLAEQGHEHRFAMGVGLNSGPVMAGNVGAEARVEYTAIGDTTNTASRLESMTKNSGTMLFVSQSTRHRMKTPPADLRRFDELQIRGREARLVVWTLDDTLVGSGPTSPPDSHPETPGQPIIPPK